MASVGASHFLVDAQNQLDRARVFLSDARNRLAEAKAIAREAQVRALRSEALFERSPSGERLRWRAARTCAGRCVVRANLKYGAEGGSRTHTPLRAHDFESCAYRQFRHFGTGDSSYHHAAAAGTTSRTSQLPPISRGSTSSAGIV